MKYRIELNEAQIRVVNAALEEFFRLPLNQWWDLSDRLCSKGVDFTKENKNHDQDFHDFIKTRDAVRTMLDAIGRVIWPNGAPPKDNEQLIAEDIWQVIRHQLYKDSGSKNTWRVDSYPPRQWGTEPLAKIEKVEG